MFDFSKSDRLLEAGELDEVDRNVFEENLRKASKKVTV
jgi:hypothetical protein